MKLYMVTQDAVTGYDTYDCMVVCAENVIDAQTMCPSGYYKWHDGAWFLQYSNGTEAREERRYDWCEPYQAKVKYLGKAEPHVKQGVLVASFNAG